MQKRVNSKADVLLWIHPGWLVTMGVTYISDSGLEWKSRVPSEPLSLRQLEDANHNDPTPGLIRPIGPSFESALLKSEMGLGVCVRLV